MNYVLTSGNYLKYCRSFKQHAINCTTVRLFGQYTIYNMKKLTLYALQALQVIYRIAKRDRNSSLGCKTHAIILLDNRRSVDIEILFFADKTLQNYIEGYNHDVLLELTKTNYKIVHHNYPRIKKANYMLN